MEVTLGFIPAGISLYFTRRPLSHSVVFLDGATLSTERVSCAVYHNTRQFLSLTKNAD